MIDASPYVTSFEAVAALDDAVRREMAALYLGMYDGSSPSLFFEDLAQKDEALLVRHGPTLVGFTTFRVFEHTWRGQRAGVVYSGDTVVAREHWGQQALAFDWISRMGAIKRERPERPLYWLLLVKGHRTFRYLPLFARSFWPHWNLDRSDLKPLADELAAAMFPRDYNAGSGVVELAESRGHLKPDIATPSPAEAARDDVAFFLARNPGYTRGHELVCVAEIETHNMKPLTLRLFGKELDVCMV
ncbi:MAG TPA: hypothetical protein VG323_14615 [Thermoanaerobaculia bacterium]|nr:hypothetical protein [Thermoanaerobaculia bacterium]